MCKPAILTNRRMFKQQVINDLAWLIQSPSLLNNKLGFVMSDEESRNLYQEIEPEMIKWDENPSVLPDQIINPQPYVGDYFENLIAFWLSKRADIEHILQRKVVMEDNRTIGEFDFLFHHRRLKQSYHWEVAVKFYLYFESEKDVIFYGPNSRDQLSIKSEKMLNQQIMLSKKSAAKKIINHYPTALLPQIVLKGYLFYPTQLWQTSIPKLPDYISRNHLKGWWTYANNPNIPQHHTDSNWLILNKPFWLAIEARTGINNAVLTYDDLQDRIKEHFQCSQKPLHLAEVMQNSRNEQIECSRGFVVPANWPQS